MKTNDIITEETFGFTALFHESWWIKIVTAGILT